MNVNAMVVSQLKKQREVLAAKLSGIDAALAAFGGTTGQTAPTPTKRRRKRTLTPEQIAKMQAGRAAARAGKAQDGQTEAQATPPQPVRESHPRLPQGPKEVPRGASLAEAAS